MAITKIKTVVLIGAGNMATHLGLAFSAHGISVIQVWNRSRRNGTILAKKLKSEYIADISAITRHADLYIIAVSDNAIKQVADSLKLSRRLVVHTSGSVNLASISNASAETGVLYPLQTFSGKGRIRFLHVPFCIEGSSERNALRLMQLAGTLSNSVHRIDSSQRLVLHMAAVFAGNFPNFMYSISEDILNKHQIPFELLEPLIRQTAGNARSRNIFSRQTGPAIRGDSNVMELHRELLSDETVYREIYDLISGSILKYKTDNG